MSFRKRPARQRVARPLPPCRRRGLASVAAGAALLYCSAWALGSGTWSNPGTSVINLNGQADFTHPDFDVGCNAAAINDNQAIPAGVNYIQGFAGNSFGTYGEANANDDDEPGCHIRGFAFGRSTVSGVGTSVADVRWKLGADAFHFCECLTLTGGCNGLYTYTSGGNANLNATINLTIDTVPPGQQVTVYYSWWSLIVNEFKPEDPLPDDPASVQNIVLQLQGTDLIAPGSADFNNIRAAAYLPAIPAQATGSFQAQGGDTITITIAGNVLARIADPPEVCNLAQDLADAHYHGQILLSIDDPLPPLPNPWIPGNASAEFSLDIGSDAELSDPPILAPDGNEVFDPGDTYPWHGPQMSFPGADGVRDDVVAFQTDFWPDPNPGPPWIVDDTRAQTCSVSFANFDPTILQERFDLDGTDALDIELRFLIPQNTPLDAPLAAFTSDCIYDDPYLLISYNDDGAPHYAWDFCPVPSASTSDWGLTHGSDSGNDELLMITTTQPWPPPPLLPPPPPPPYPVPSASLGAIIPIHSEQSLHDNLSPSVDPAVSEELDDDVDALDVNVGGGACDTWYISADHEATGMHPSIPGLPLDPGDIYEVLALGGLWKVVDHALHLGLPDGTDIDGFEFVWLRHCPDPNDPTLCQDVLALLFTVDEDDFIVAGDQSGGLDPRVIYASFLNGFHFPYLSQALQDNIDAIAASPLPFVPAGPPVFVNNDCVQAASIGVGVTSVSNQNATTDGPPEPCGFLGDVAGNSDADIWFQFIAPCTGTATFTFQPQFDQLAAIYHLVCPLQGGPLLTCDLIAAGATQSTSLHVVAGESYIIRVGGLAGQQGAGTITIDCLPIVAPPNDDCLTPLLISDGVHSYSNIGATTDGPADPCPPASFTGVDDDDIWFDYIATCTGIANIEIQPILAHQLMAVYDGSCPQTGGSLIACVLAAPGIPTALSVSAVAGQSYIIRIGTPPLLPQTDGTLTVGCVAQQPCPADIAPVGALDGIVGPADLGQMLASWGPCLTPCPADIAPPGGNSTVGPADLAEMLANWGQCP